MQALIPDTLWEIGGLAATIYSIGQARQHHQEQLDQSKKHHEIEMDLAIKQHKKNLVETKRVYLLELFTNLEQHFQQLNADLISSGKEAERDMFDQRNQNFQTIILASSVMFTALSTVIIDGVLPEQTSEGLIVAFSLTSAFSFAFLFLSMVICMELVMRASSFMYRRARNHTEQLRQAIKDTKAMMEELRNGTRNHRQPNLAPKTQEPTQQPSQQAAVPDTSEKLVQDYDRLAQQKEGVQGGLSSPNVAKPRARKHRIISELDEEGLEREWNNHEIELQRFLAERERINDATALIGVDEKVLQDNPSLRERLYTTRRSFQEFWNDSCKFWAELSILFFYGGTINLLLAIMVFMWAQFLHEYHSLVGAIIAISLITFTLVLGICSAIGLRWMKAMEMLRHPEEANRRRIGHNHMHSFSSQYSIPTASDYERSHSIGNTTNRQHSTNSSRGTLSRGASISFLPEFGQDYYTPDDDEYDAVQGSSKKYSDSASSKSYSDKEITQQDQVVYGQKSVGIAATSPEGSNEGDANLSYSPSLPSTPTSANRSRASNVPALFRRPSPRNLFPGDASDSGTETPRNLPPRPQTTTRLSLVSPRSGDPPPTPSTTETGSSMESNSRYPPLPHSATRNSLSASSTPQPASSAIDRRAMLGRQSSAPLPSSARPPLRSSPQKHLI